jgi:BioD-like phosphotransacetylase family protein
MKKVFIAATKQNDGKTTVSLGLISNLNNRFKNIGFIKPIGQRYLEEEGLKVDEDSILIEEAFGIKCGLKDMNPIAVERGFTENYILHPDKDTLSQQIKDAYKRVSGNNDLVIIEGTGHAGVGSVFDHSNATVAKLLDAKVILISSGGVGRPIDEIILNKALFDKIGVEVLGVIVNKVLPEKLNKISKLVCMGLKKFDIDVLGVIPYLPFLSYPSVGQILEEEKYKVLSGKEQLNNVVKKIIIGAMQPHNALAHIQDGSLVITPGDRDDMLLTILSCHLSEAKKDVNISGIILTGGIMPSDRIMTLMKSSGIPVLLSGDDTYNVASSVHDLTVKIRPKDKEKINLVHKMFKENVDLDKILEGM